MLSAAVIAHQGGWDEILLVLGPLAVFAWLLVLANRRATKIADGRGELVGEGEGWRSSADHHQFGGDGSGDIGGDGGDGGDGD